MKIAIQQARVDRSWLNKKEEFDFPLESIRRHDARRESVGPTGAVRKVAPSAHRRSLRGLHRRSPGRLSFVPRERARVMQSTPPVSLHF